MIRQFLQGLRAGSIIRGHLPEAGWYVLVFVVTAALIAWNTQARVTEFSTRQTQASADAMDGAAHQLGEQLVLLRKAVQLLADRERGLLRQLAVDPDNGVTRAHLERRTRELFPEAFAVTLADPDGRVLLDDMEGLVGPVCQEDIARFTRDPQGVRTYLHPNPSGSHFDVMVQVPLTASRPWVFFVSFRIEVITRILANAQISGHELLLLRRDIPDLIEITAEGSRETLQRNVRLSAGEVRQLARRVPVEGTTWDVADLATADVVTQYAHDRWFEVGVILASMLVLGAIVLTHLTRQQRRVNAANEAIRAQADELRRNEAQLRENNVLQRAILDSANYTIISTDPFGTIRTFNDAAERLLGYRAEEVVGKTTPAVIHDAGEIRQRAAELSRELGYRVEPGFEAFVAKARTALADEREWTYVRKDGSRFPVLLSITALRDARGAITGFLGIGSDITHRRQDAERLRLHHLQLDAISRAQARFIRDADARAVFDDLLSKLLALTQSEFGFIGEVLRDAENRPFLKTHAITNVAWNEEARAFYARHAPQGMEFHNLDTLFGAALTTGKPVIANDPVHDPRRGGLPPGHPPLHAFLGVPFYLGDRLVGMAGIANRPDGYDESLAQFLQPLFTTCAHIIEALRNDKSRRTAEAELRKSATRIQTILDTVADGILTLNDAGIIETFNQAAERIFGYTAGEAIGRHIHVLMPNSFLAVPHDATDAGKTSSDPLLGWGREVAGRRKDSSTFPAELILSEMRLGERYLFTGLVRDITERKKIERLKSEFVSTVSHELRTPLTSIRGSLGLMAGGMAGKLHGKAVGLIDIAVRNCERLTLLINDILDIERIESDRMQFDIVPQPLLPLIQQAIEANRGYGESLGVCFVLTTVLPEIRVNVDGERLIQVMTNLLSNAAKFSPPDSHVEIMVTRPHGMVRVSVIDCGPGVPMEFRERIFQRFAQADASDTRRRGGTGLGLSIAKAIVERFGGHIGFDSVVGKGAVFHFDLPVWHGVETESQIPAEGRSRWAP